MNHETVPVDTLKKIPIFQNLNETECRQIGAVSTLRRFKPGENVLRQGEQSQDLWVVLKGKCEVVRQVKAKTGGVDSVTLATLEPYSHFGEMSFFHPAPHSADVRAQTDLELLRISHADYNDLIAEGIWAAYKLAYNVVKGLAARLRRMDEWVAELLGEQCDEDTQVPEWHTFREKLFSRWNG